MKLLKGILVIIINTSIAISMHSYATNNSATKPWSLLVYYGSTAHQAFGELISGQYNSFGEDLYTLELAYTLAPHNPLQQFFKPLWATVQVATNFTYRYDWAHNDNIKEGNLYLIWRWSKFPWERYLHNTLAIGDGFSYDSHPPLANRLGDADISYSSASTSRLLNYLVLEATLALPDNPDLQLVARIHHQCTAWGLFPKRANAGSTSIGLGIRYSF